MNTFRSRKMAGGWPLLVSMLVTWLATTAAGQPQPPSSPGSNTNTDTSDNASGPVQQLEKYTVTGSFIPSAGEQLSIPVAVISSSDVEVSGEKIDTLNLLRKISTGIQGSIGSENATIGTATTYGGSDIQNHGLPVLVLLDGRRVTSSPAEAVGGDRFVDLNMIPAAAIDRIEVLEDGASATYGSDAIGGVINIILKKDYNGWEVGGHYGYSPNTGHYAEREGYVVGGVANDKTSITISAEYAKHDPIFFSQRPYTNPYYATEYYPGIIDVYNNATGVDEDYMLKAGLNAPPGGGTYTIDQLVAQGVYTDLGPDSDPATVEKIQQGFNLADKQTLISSMKRASFLINAAHKISGDQLQFFGNLLYTNTQTQTSLNAQPIYPYVSTPYTDLIEEGVTPPPPGAQYVPYTIPGNPFSQAWMEQGAVTDENGNATAGYGVDAHNRFIQYPRIFRNDSTLVRTSDGFKGEINEDYGWEVGGTLNRYRLDYYNDNVISQTGFFDALAAGTINPFAITQAPGVLPGSILGTATMTGVSSRSDADFLFHGKPYKLPGGDLAFAIGGQYSRESLTAEADLNTETKGWINAPSILPITKSRTISAYYGELEIPVFGPEQSIPWLYTLNTDVAYRVERYSGVGTAKVPKLSLKYQPVNNDLSFRFSAGKSFLAPPLYDLYGPTNTGASQSINFKAYGTTVVQPNVQFEDESGSNPNLKPSTANTWSAGINYTPSQVNGLGITVDFFVAHQVGLFGSPSEETAANSVEQLGAASPFVNYVHFGTPTGPTATAPGQVSAHPKSAVWLVTPESNLGGQFVRGFDGSIEYVIPNRGYGRWDFKSNFTIYNTFQLQEEPDQAYYNYAGTDSFNENTVPRYKTYTTIDWRLKGFDVTIGHTFVPSVKDVGPGGIGAEAPVHVSSYSQWDAVVGYEFNKSQWTYVRGLSVQLGVNNVFNRMPPISLHAQTETNADVGFYDDAIGRLYYVDASYKF